MMRVRRLEIQPGGVVPWHSHADRPALIFVVSGEIFENAGNCAAPILHKAGEVARETHATSHWWNNAGKMPVVLLSFDILHDRCCESRGATPPVLIRRWRRPSRRERRLPIRRGRNRSAACPSPARDSRRRSRVPPGCHLRRSRCGAGCRRWQRLTRVFGRQNGLRMQRCRHIKCLGVAIGTAERDVARTQVGTDTLEELAEVHA